MYVTSLIAQAGMLDATLVEKLRNVWGGGIVEWLAPDEAAEFQLEARPSNFDKIRLICRRWRLILPFSIAKTGVKNS